MEDGGGELYYLQTLMRKGYTEEKEKKLEGTDGLCVCDGLFLWGSVCVFQLWTVDYARIHEDVYLLVSVSLFLCQSADTDFKLLYSKSGGTVQRQHSHQPGDTLHHLTDLQRCSESA